MPGYQVSQDNVKYSYERNFETWMYGCFPILSSICFIWRYVFLQGFDNASDSCRTSRVFDILEKNDIFSGRVYSVRTF